MAGGDAGESGSGAQQQTDDFFDQMLSTLPSAWADLGAGAAEDLAAQSHFGDDSSALLASRLRQHQIGGGDVVKSSASHQSQVMLQLSDLHRHGGLGGEESGLFTDRSAPAPEEMEGGFKSPNSAVRIVVVLARFLLPSFLLVTSTISPLTS